MAVIYVPPDPRWQAVQAIGQGLGNAFQAYAQKKSDAAAIQAAQQAMSDQQSPQPTQQQQGQQPPPPTIQPGQPGSTPPGTVPQATTTGPQASSQGGDQTPQISPQPTINFAKLGLAMATASPQAQRTIAMMLQQKAEAWKEARDQARFQASYQQKEQEFGIQNRREALAETREERMATAQQQQMRMEGARLGMEGERLAIAKAEAPLMMEEKRTSIAKNVEQLKQLQQQQSLVWSPDEIQKAASNYVAQGFKNAPNFGWGGAANQTNRSNFWKAVNDLPMTPDQRRQWQIAAQEQQTEAQTTGRVAANLNISTEKAAQSAALVKQELQKLAPQLSDVKIFNQWKQGFLAGTNDPRFVRLNNYVNNLTAAYARAMNPNGASTNELRAEAQRFVQAASGPDVMAAQVDSVLKDLDREKTAVSTSTSDLVHRSFNYGVFGGQDQGGPTASHVPAANQPLPPVGDRVVGKTTWTAPGGQTYIWSEEGGQTGWKEQSAPAQ